MLLVSRFSVPAIKQTHRASRSVGIPVQKGDRNEVNEVLIMKKPARLMFCLAGARDSLEKTKYSLPQHGREA
jgi:hypothetical protein